MKVNKLITIYKDIAQHIEDGRWKAEEIIFRLNTTWPHSMIHQEKRSAKRFIACAKRLYPENQGEGIDRSQP